MATYLQWSKNRPVRRVTWVCGPEGALVRDVVAAHREDAPPGQCLTVFAGEAPERAVWDLLLSVPPSGGRRVAVYGAEKLAALDRVAMLAEADELATAYVTLVSAAADFERSGGQLAPHLAALQAARSAQLVRCCAPSKAEDQESLVASWWPGASRSLGAAVLARCGSLDRAWLACEQARLADLEPERRMLAVVCPSEPGGELADHLMAGRRAQAMAAATALPRAELGQVTGLLAARLAAAEQVRDAMRDGLDARAAAASRGVDRYLASKVLPHAGLYDPARVRRCRRLLAGIDAAYRAGVPAGAAESLAALWG
jgi:hypothetical protein